jgi:hypothetical protein
VTNTDPPNEVDDGEAPTDRDIQTPDARTLEYKPGSTVGQTTKHGQTSQYAYVPKQWRFFTEDDIRDLLGNRHVGLIRPNDRVVLQRMNLCRQLGYTPVACVAIA